MTIEETYAEIQALSEQASQYHTQGQHVLALECYQKAITLAAPLRDARLMAYLLAGAGGEHRDSDNYYHAIELMVAALALVPYEEDTLSQRAHIKKLLAITFRDVFGPKKVEVMQLLGESRADYAQIGDKSAEANVLQHIGLCYVELGRLPEADDMLQEAFQKAKVVNDLQLQGWILNNMAELEIERDEWGLAVDYAQKAREKVCAVQDLEGEADTLITEARIRLRMGQTEEALTAANRALEIYIQNKNLHRTIRARHHIAKILNKQRRLDEAAATLHEAMRTAERLDLRRYQALLYLDLGSTELERKNYGLALQHGIKARDIALEESLGDLLEDADDLLGRCPSTEGDHLDRS